MALSILRRTAWVFLAFSAVALWQPVKGQSCGTDCPLYTLAFADEFNGNTVDESVWNFRNDSKAESAQLAANVDESGGYMNINLKKQTVGNYNYTGGGLISIPNFQYGYYEARLKINNGTGWHSAFWLMAGNGADTYSQATGYWTEIDIFEIDSISPMSIRHNIFEWDSSGSKELTSNVMATADDFRDFHIHGALWNETGITFYIDGAVVSYLAYGPSVWVHDYLNIWMTCIAYRNPPDNSKLPSQVNTDYIHYYQKDFYLTSGSLCRSNAQGSTPCPSNAGYAESGSNWGASSLYGYTYSLSTRYACSVAGSAATWTKTIPFAGTYSVSAWIMARSDSDQAAAYTVLQNGNVVASTTVNQTLGTTAYWGVLDSSVTVAAGDVLEVKVTASGKGCLRADTIKVVRVA